MRNSTSTKRPAYRRHLPAESRKYREHVSVSGWLGRVVINQWWRFLDQAGFAGRILLLSWQGRARRWRLMTKLTLNEIFKLAFGSALLILLVGAIMGILWAVLWFGTLSNIGGLESLSIFLVNIHVIQIAPILTTVIIILRYGAPMVWEMGGMKSEGEFETLIIMGIPPEHYLAMPRILGSLVSFPGLMALFILASLLGAYIVAWQMIGQPLLDFFLVLTQKSSPKHFVIMAFKCIAISLAVSFFSVYNGFKIKKRGLRHGAGLMRTAMGEAFFYSVLTSVLVSVFYV